MSLLGAFTASIRRAVSDAVAGGVADGVKRVLEGTPAPTGQAVETEEAQALLLAWSPEESAPVKGRRKAE